MPISFDWVSRKEPSGESVKWYAIVKSTLNPCEDVRGRFTRDFKRKINNTTQNRINKPTP